MATTETGSGYELLRGTVPPDAVDRVLRHIHRDVATRGLPQEWLSEWLWNAHWFPHLRWDDEVLQLLEHLPTELRDGELCDPQIVGQMPDDPEQHSELQAHVDQLPDWSNGRPYRRILGVALTRNGPENGGLTVWPLDGAAPREVALDPGDVLVMAPRLPHASGTNRTGSIRYCVYFRFLEQEQPPRIRLPNRIGLITLACHDIERMTRLLRDLGWPETPESDEHHRTFQCTNGCVIALYAARHYEPHFGPPADGFRAFTLAVNLASYEEVERVYEALREVDGVELLEEPAEAPWGGGFSWRDPEGNVWDVAWAKGSTFDERGGIAFP